MAARHDIAHDVLAMTGYGNEPAVLVLADSEDAERRIAETVTRAGARVIGVLPIRDGLAGIDRQVRLGAVVVDIDRDGGRELDRLLDRLDIETAAARLGAVVTTAPELIDIVAARIPHFAVELLCRPSDEERVMALRAALSPRETLVSDVNRGSATPRLQQLSEEVGRIASILAELSEEEADAPAQGAAQRVSPATIRAIIRARRLRDRFFPGELFADPAWDMMLDLMAARLEQRQVAVSSLCIAAAVPPTTALRWIKTLTEAGVFARVADPQDGRRVYVELTGSAAAAFEAYLRSVAGLTTLAV